MGSQIVKQDAAGYEQRAEHKVHENIGGKVEDGAGRSNPEHEVAHAGSIPFPGLCDELLVHVVPRNCRAAQIVDQIQEDEMHAHHGQEGQQHREHIAEVGGCRHLDVLDHVGVGLASLNDALLQNHQVFFKENDVRRFLGYIHGGIHGNADVSGFHSGSIVDAITHEAHRMTVLPEDGHHTGFLIGGQLGEYIRGFCGFCQLRVGHVFEVSAQ